MAKYTESVCRLCRRESQKLFLKGERCFTDKCSFERREYPPGQHGQGRVKFSEYAIQLRQKQKVKRMYGMLESQFRRGFEEASRKRGITGDNLLIGLERRLDNVAYRMGVGTSRAQARQLVLHRHVTINGKVVTIPSFKIKKGDVLAVKDQSKQLSVVQNGFNLVKRREVPQWLEVDFDKGMATVRDLPARADIGQDINEQLIVELYSK